MFSSYWLTIEPKDYFWDVAGDGRNCVLLIMKNQYDFLIMGLPIFSGYYAHFSYENSTIGFAPLLGSNKDPLELGVAPVTSILEAG